MLLTIHHIAVDGWSLARVVRRPRARLPRQRSRESPRACPTCRSGTPTSLVWDLAAFDERLLTRRADELQGDRADLQLGGAREVSPGRRPPGRAAPLRHSRPTCSRRWASWRRSVARHAVRRAARGLLRGAAAAGRRVTEFLIGAVTANRRAPGVEDLVGFFVNTVPLRCECDHTRPRSRSAAPASAVRGVRLHDAPARCRSTSWSRKTGAGLPSSVGFAMQNMPAARIDEPRWTPPEVLRHRNGQVRRPAHRRRDPGRRGRHAGVRHRSLPGRARCHGWPRTSSKC